MDSSVKKKRSTVKKGKINLQAILSLDISSISQVHIMFKVYCLSLHKLPFDIGNGRKIECVLN